MANFKFVEPAQGAPATPLADITFGKTNIAAARCKKAYAFKAIILQENGFFSRNGPCTAS